MTDQFYTVSQLNNYIKDVLNASFPQPVWVCGEIQGYNRNKDKNHIFFEITETKQRSNDVLARMGLVIFAGVKFDILNKLCKSENAFELKDDIEVKFLCRIDFYPPHGAVRLIVEDIDPTYTLGKIAQERQKLIALLTEKGVLEKNKQLILPQVSLRLGLITSHDSAAYNDFCDEIRASGYGFQVEVYHAIVQGKDAEKSIVKGLKLFNKKGDVDAIVITRGGGSISDLSCFDSQLIAETIAASKIPVVTGIGHEINVSVTDLAAHTFAKTPTAIAQFLIECVSEFLDLLDEKQGILLDLAQRLVQEQKQHSLDLARQLQYLTSGYFQKQSNQLAIWQERLSQIPQNKIVTEKRRIGEIRQNLPKIIRLRFQAARTTIENLEKMVSFASPEKTLQRGFSITRNSKGKAVSQAKSLPKGEVLVTQFAQGEVESKVM